MNKSLSLVIALFFGTVCNSIGLPGTQLCKPIPESGAWSMSEKNGEEQIDVQIFGGRRVVLVRSSGETKQQVWISGGLLYRMMNGELDSLPATEKAIPYYSHTAFYGADWLAPEFYVGEEEINGILCQVYKREIRLEMPAGIPEEFRNSVPVSAVEKAWIVTQTKLPFQVEKEGRVWRYTFFPPPTTVSFPPTVEAAIVRDVQLMKRVQTRFGAQ